MSETAIELQIPGSPDYLRLARLAVADAGARVGFTFEDIDDLRIAVDELCFALANGNAELRLCLTYHVGQDRLVVDGRCDRDGVTPELSDLAQAILAAVVDDYRLEGTDTSTTFQFTKALAGS